jgi:hypothetical protein
MNVGLVPSLANTAVAQNSGATVDRAKQDAGHFQRQVASTQQAADAAGIGHTNEEHGASDRDADGRRLWEFSNPAPSDEGSEAPTDPNAPRQSRDPNDDRGTQIDFTA